MEDMSELMNELVATECAPHIHHNTRNLAPLEDITAAKLDAAMKYKEGEEIALKSKSFSMFTWMRDIRALKARPSGRIAASSLSIDLM